jgi:2-methylisocitrate lyase-like PEP mutase family enzyme
MKNLDMLRRFKAAAGVPMSIQMLGWLEKDLSAENLSEIAGLAVFPLVPLMTVADAMMKNLKALHAAHTTKNLPLPVMDHNEFANLLDFPAIQDIQRRLLPGADEAPRIAAE